MLNSNHKHKILPFYYYYFFFFQINAKVKIYTDKITDLAMKRSKEIKA